jgi:YidC/Oxa1 family membrane protein insertase
VLGFLHDYVLFDWGMAIIGLVLIVRALLHPLTKKAQINMQRFGRVMQKIKPEIEKVQKRYKDDPRKAQQEQLRLMQEHGVSPLQMLGCLPMLLQMPIWIALWAGLYFAYELWQQPAFYGIFQMFGGWTFLADLSAPDQFIEFPTHIPLFMGISITGFNVLPLLMGVVFYVQQKYLTPPPSATMSEDQIRQQKIIRVMMVVMFPIMLYTAPSGLTLYIMTSSLFGIIESKYIRSHIDALDLEPKKQPVQKKSKKKKPKDPVTRAYSEALDRAKDKRRRGPSKSFKKRK